MSDGQSEACRMHDEDQGEPCPYCESAEDVVRKWKEWNARGNPCHDDSNAKRLLRMVHQWACMDHHYRGGNLWREVERELS